MDIRQLRTLVHVAELGSISLAADRLHIAQSALTRHIQTLERELAVSLFHRHGRGVELTPQGSALFSRATIILRELEQARAEIRANAEILNGEVSFGIPPTIADVLSGPLIEKFLCLHPQVKVRIVSGFSGHVLDWLQRGTIDLGILYEAEHPPTIRSRPLLDEQLFLIDPANTQQAMSSVSLREAASGRLVLPSKQHGLRLLLEKVAAKNGCRLKPIAEADLLPVQIDLVRRGIASTILPILPVFTDVKLGRLAARPIEAPRITRRLILPHTIDRPVSMAAQRFTEMVVTEVSERLLSGHWEGTLAGHDAEGADILSRHS